MARAIGLSVTHGHQIGESKAISDFIVETMNRRTAVGTSLHRTEVPAPAKLTPSGCVVLAAFCTTLPTPQEFTSQPHPQLTNSYSDSVLKIIEFNLLD